MAHTMMELLNPGKLSEREYIDYINNFEATTVVGITFPHCDSLVLHSPGTCNFCDMNPDWQKARMTWKINFTNSNSEGFKPCPSLLRRPKETVEKWPGNIPTNFEVKLTTSADTFKYNLKVTGRTSSSYAEGTCPKCGHNGDWINLALICPTHGRFAG